MGLLWLRCGTYGDLWAAVAAAPTLWGIYGLLWLRCGTYEGSVGCCGCGVGPMGLIYGPYGNLLAAALYYSIVLECYIVL